MAGPHYSNAFKNLVVVFSGNSMSFTLASYNFAAEVSLPVAQVATGGGRQAGCQGHCHSLHAAAHTCACCFRWASLIFLPFSSGFEVEWRGPIDPRLAQGCLTPGHRHPFSSIQVHQCRASSYYCTGSPPGQPHAYLPARLTDDAGIYLHVLTDEGKAVSYYICKS